MVVGHQYLLLYSLEWIGEDNLVGCEDLVVRFKMEIGVQHLQHELDKPILVPADKPRPSLSQAQVSGFESP